MAMEKQLNDVKKAYQREIEKNATRSSLTKNAEAKYEQVCKKSILIFLSIFKLVADERTKAIIYKWRYYAVKMQLERLRRTSSRKSSTVTTPRDSDMSFRFNQSLQVSFIDDNYADQEDIGKCLVPVFL